MIIHSNYRQRMSKYRNIPIYGRVVHNPPFFRPPIKPVKHKAYEEVARLYGIAPPEPRRQIATLRMAGDSPAHTSVPAINFSPQQGSFQHLKVRLRYLIQFNDLHDFFLHYRSWLRQSDLENYKDKEPAKKQQPGRLHWKIWPLRIKEVEIGK